MYRQIRQTKRARGPSTRWFSVVKSVTRQITAKTIYGRFFLVRVSFPFVWTARPDGDRRCAFCFVLCFAPTGGWTDGSVGGRARTTLSARVRSFPACSDVRVGRARLPRHMHTYHTAFLSSSRFVHRSTRIHPFTFPRKLVRRGAPSPPLPLRAPAGVATPPPPPRGDGHRATL